MIFNNILYEILGVDRNSTRKEIKDSFIKLGRLYHPDKVVFLI